MNKEKLSSFEKEPSQFFLCKDMHGRAIATKDPHKYENNGPTFAVQENDLTKIKSILAERRYSRRVGGLLDLYNTYKQKLFNSMIDDIEGQTGKSLTEWIENINSALKELSESSNPNMPVFIKERFNVSHEWGKCLWDAYKKYNK